MYAPAERADTLPLFLAERADTLPLFLLYHYMHSVGEKVIY
jgi:hypothetical protein